jgi:hypothetical protein
MGGYFSTMTGEPPIPIPAELWDKIPADAQAAVLVVYRLLIDRQEIDRAFESGRSPLSGGHG